MNALTQPVSLLRSYASFGEKGEKYVVTITKKVVRKKTIMTFLIFYSQDLERGEKLYLMTKVWIECRLPGARHLYIRIR